MKTANFPSVRVEPELRAAAEDVLQDGESLSNFVEQAIRDNIARRLNQREFVARGLASRAQAKDSGDYVEADDVLAGLQARLDEAKARARAKQKR
ncbi:YlcI/YnfO family protein [Burkholderia sp. SRS-W-2-2016]|uniref:YlcI/YnfO family protein n=1 Tax=Burkholderia sp. SRS-W-2-2016 TaxID=1926878 RepID=UPI0009F8BAD0|nr:YlcI/YnfO family protein [Burkholderia sp. SRS-W-2-2016]